MIDTIPHLLVVRWSGVLSSAIGGSTRFILAFRVSRRFLEGVQPFHAFRYSEYRKVYARLKIKELRKPHISR